MFAHENMVTRTTVLQRQMNQFQVQVLDNPSEHVKGAQCDVGKSNILHKLRQV